MRNRERRICGEEVENSLLHLVEMDPVSKLVKET